MEPYDSKKIDNIVYLFKNNDLKYTNYPPTYQQITWNSFFSEESANKLRSVKKRIDPNGIFYNNY